MPTRAEATRPCEPCCPPHSDSVASRTADGAVDPLLERAEFVPGDRGDACLLAFVLCQWAGLLGVEMLDVVDHQPVGGVRPMPPHVVGLVNQACALCLASTAEV